jgi:hypothetical protein
MCGMRSIARHSPAARTPIVVATLKPKLAVTATPFPTLTGTGHCPIANRGKMSPSFSAAQFVQPPTASETLQAPLCSVEAEIDLHYPRLLPSVKAGLATFGTMALAGRTKPLSLIYEATSGYGKSAVVEMFFPIEALKEYAYRCDKFTPKAFVTHVANVPRERLAEIDLLPKLAGKVLVTKELSPIFRGNLDEVRENFAVLIPVLDGKGFTSNTGAQGKRGYESPILFNWIGATTPLPRETHKIMYQLGTRLLFYEVPSKVPSEEELVKYAERDDASQGEVDCQKAVNAFLIEFFKQNPVGSVNPANIKIPKALLRLMTRWALLLSKVRAGLRYEKEGKEWKAVAANQPEGPYKLINYFKELARGHALIHGRTRVTAADEKVIAHVVLSCVPGHLRPILRALRKSASVTAPECEKLCGVTRPTARRYLEELNITGIVRLKHGNESNNTPHSATPYPKFRWLVP